MQRPTLRFSKDRFERLSRQAQHKKCAELIRAGAGRMAEDAISEYGRWAIWMNIQPLLDWSFESLEARFHWHMQNAARGISEHDFLTLQTQSDRQDSPHKWLGICTYLDGLRSCYNIGNIIRTAESLRLGPVIFSPEMVEASHPQIKKTGMGAEAHVPLHKPAGSSEINAIAPRPWIAIETIARAESYIDYPSFQAPMTLIVGNEARGISQSILQQCDGAVQIPLYGIKNSLNVANSHAIVASYASHILRILPGQKNQEPCR